VHRHDLSLVWTCLSIHVGVRGALQENTCNVCAHVLVALWGPHIYGHGGACDLVSQVCVCAGADRSVGVLESACMCVRVYHPCTTRPAPLPSPPSLPLASQSPQHVDAPSCMRLAALSISVCLTKKNSDVQGTPGPGPFAPASAHCAVLLAWGDFSPAPSTICCFRGASGPGL
jgi:hypothetical protein